MRLAVLVALNEPGLWDFLFFIKITYKLILGFDYIFLLKCHNFSVILHLLLCMSNNRRIFTL